MRNVILTLSLALLSILSLSAQTVAVNQAATSSGWYRVGGYEVFELNEMSRKGTLDILITRARS
ncbi:MAG: hypothetical protein GXY09_06015 [Bacteroidales bacterium]|nr:hypothetical protein [Bacteroidales bacterium]